jgi:hypothetical protein
MEVGTDRRTVHRVMLGRRTIAKDDRFSSRIVARDHASRGFWHQSLSS